MHSSGWDNETHPPHRVYTGPHLFEAMPASARTLIPYVSRGATVARATRQALLDRLTGQYLVVTTGADASLPNAVAMVQRDAACRWVVVVVCSTLAMLPRGWSATCIHRMAPV